MIADKLCIDCGGTKVSYAIFSKENELLDEKTIELPCNINNNYENFVKVVADLKSKYNPNEVLVGVAGWIAFTNKDEVLQLLGVPIVSDVNLASMALLNKNQSLGVILGTGSVFFTKKQVYGGFGHSLGDEGSGYYFGKLVLKKYLEEFEENYVSDLRLKVEKYFGKSGREILASALKNEKENFSRLAREFMDDPAFEEVFNVFKTDFLSRVECYLKLTSSEQIVVSGSILNSAKFIDFVFNDKRFVINRTPLSHAILYKA